MIELAEEIINGILSSKAVQFVLIWIGIIIGGWVITQLAYTFLTGYLGSDSILSGLLLLLEVLPLIFALVGLASALKSVRLAD